MIPAVIVFLLFIVWGAFASIQHHLGNPQFYQCGGVIFIPIIVAMGAVTGLIVYCITLGLGIS